MRRRSDILGSLHNRTLHILIRQLPLFINQRGTLQLSAKVVSTGDKYFFSTENAKCWPFLGPFGLFCCKFPHFLVYFLKSYLPKLTNIRYDPKFELPGYCRSV